MTVCILCEKPSVAASVAAVLGVKERHDGYLSGNGYLVTWAFGHLVQLAMPEAYGYTGFRRENLPILPQEFKYIPRQIREGKEYKPDPGVLKQLKVIKEVFDRSDRIVVATDAGREGEAIHRYIYNYLGCRKPCLRLWISSLTDRAIREGLDNLKPGSDYDNLYRAAEARAIADWEIGLNATQALSIAAGQGIYSLGRVQTPTLMMICSRYLENRDFTPQTYFLLKVTAEKDGTPFAAISELRYETLPAANAALAAVTATGTVQVSDVQRREVSQEPPLLYDLTALQKEANGRYGFSADKTLSVAQSLYEKKVLSYPRTGSRYLSDDVFDEIPDRIALLERYPAFAAHAAALKGASLNSRSVDVGKVTDHHALIITECLPGELSADERTVYDMVAARLLEAFSARCLKDVTTVSFTAGNSVFTAKGTVIRSAGWRAVRNERDEDDEGTAALPPLQPGESFPLQSAECVEKQTKPRPLHTESSLLSAMEHCGRELRDDELRITLWMNGNHIAYARFDGILMIDGASLAALFSRNRVATIYEDVAQQRGKPGRPGRLRRLLDTPLDTFGLSQRIVRACRELGVFTVEHLLVHLRRFRFSRLYCVRNFGSGSAAETLRRLRQDGLTDGGSPRDFKVLYP